MTGHQDHPGTGHTLSNGTAIGLRVKREAVGIKHISVVDPFDLARVENVLREEVQRDEPSLIIMQRPCALLDRSQARWK